MLQKADMTAQDVAIAVPRCPACGCRSYTSLTENERDGFRLKTLRCDVCNYDILAEARQLEFVRREPSSAPLVFACLLFLLVLEVLALTGLLWM